MTEMKIQIHRGQNQIGGSVIEIFTETTRIFLDIGANMDDAKAAIVPKVEGLFFGKQKCDAVFISHYHADHIGLSVRLLPGIPVYMGETAYKIWNAAETFKNHAITFKPRFVHDREPVSIGDMVITPFRCDHSAYDAYMYLIEADGEKVLYTGDFRSHGRQDFDALLSALPEVDTLITEGTTLSRETQTKAVKEEDLVGMAAERIKDCTGPVFMLMSPMNIDRLITAYRIARETDRTFLVDPYAVTIARAMGAPAPQFKTDPGIRVFMPDGNAWLAPFVFYGKCGTRIRGMKDLKVFMCVRPGMKPFLTRLSQKMSFEGGVLIYSMFAGHLEKPSFVKFLDFMEKKGLEICTIHTSGHADAETIDRLIKKVNPKTIIPLHTECAEWFLRYETERTVML